MVLIETETPESKRWYLEKGWRSVLYFDERGRFDRERFKIDAESFFEERQLGVTGYRLRLVGGKLWQGDELAVERLEKALKTYDNERFLAEKAGWLTLEAMMTRKLEEGGGGWFVIASPPGETYRIPGKPAMSATFLFRLREDGSVLVYSIYKKEIEARKHWEIVTTTVPEESWFELNEAMKIVATPVFVGGDNEITVVLKELGIENIEELEERMHLLEKKWFDEDTRSLLINELANRVEIWKWMNKLEVVDEVIERVSTAWAYGRLSGWSDSQWRLGRWLDIQAIQVLRELGEEELSLRFAEVIGLTMNEWITWSGEWQYMVNDPLFRERYMMSMHGGGIGLGQDNLIVMGADDWRRQFLNEKKEKTLTCPKCQHQFATSKNGEVKCPKCGARLS